MCKTMDLARYFRYNKEGARRWCDRFGQYGVKVSFWASRTLKIVISPSKTTPRNDVFGWLIITPSGGGGVLISGQYICSYHICTCRGVNSGRHDSPYIRKLSLDHDSGGLAPVVITLFTEH